MSPQKQSTRISRCSLKQRDILYVAFLLFFIALGITILFRNAWVCDDAYITFRSVDNLVNGYGPTWNPAERVQAYTHPLWMFFFSAFYAVTHEAYFTAITVSACLTVAACLGLCLLTNQRRNRFAALVALFCSKAFVDYSTSGLENALSYLLAGALLLALHSWKNRQTELRLFYCVCIASLLVLNRMDYALLVGPVLLYVFCQAFRNLPARHVIGAIIGGGLPFAAWELFSFLYYGVPFPNTAYAKLNTGIALTDSCRQGLLYFKDSLQKDPVTLPVIAVATAVGFFKGRHLRWLAAGILLYLVYVVRIGGDFMSGRFFAVPFICAVGILIQQRVRMYILIPATAALLVGALISNYSPLLTGPSYTLTDDWRITGISDERGAYYQHTGLLKNLTATNRPNHPWIQEGLQARNNAGQNGKTCIIRNTIGFFGYAAGPRVHIVDELALADPLLARRPARDRREGWRIGHYWRTLPEGYMTSLQSGTNTIADPATAELFNTIQAVVSTNVPLWSPNRFSAIIRLNTQKQHFQ